MLPDDITKDPELTLFKQIDINGDDTIDLDEFVKAAQKNNQLVSIEATQATFDEADSDGSLFLTLEEFRASI